jgi:hypothetical protein
MATWSYKIVESGVTLRDEQVAVVATILRDGKEWAGREIVLSLAEVKAATTEQLKGLIDDHVATIVNREGTAETGLKAAFDAAFRTPVEVPADKIEVK